MKITYNNFKIALINITLCSTIFDAYCFLAIGNFPLTISLLLLMILLLTNILDCFKRKINVGYLFITLMFMILAILSYVLSPITASITSVFLLMFYLVCFCTTTPFLTKKDFYSLFKRYWVCIIVVMLFGLYQAIAYNFDLPFQEIEILTKVEGFNTTNLVYINNLVFQRVHSICLEPSIFSQLCALGIGLSIIYSKHRVTKIILIILFIIAMVLSFSGTGIIILAFFFIFYISKNKRNVVFLISIVSILAIIGIIVIFSNNQLVEYFLNRIAELSDPKASAAIRFINPYVLMFKTFLNLPLGIGPGNNEMIGPFLNLGAISLTAGYSKPGIEYGFLGFVLFLIMVVKIYSAKKYNKQYTMVYIYFLLLNFVNDLFLQSYFWIFAMVLIYGIQTKNTMEDSLCD